MPDLTITCLDRRGQSQQHTHHVVNLYPSTVAQVVDLFEAQVGTVLAVDCNGRNLYKLRDPVPPRRNTRIIS
jgi:hypothetical protein